MKERPILFSAPMVNAILEGRKTQTRRVVKPQPFYTRLIPNPVFAKSEKLRNAETGFIWPNAKADVLALCPYGQPGDRLWVRESSWIYGAWQQIDDGDPRTFHPIGRKVVYRSETDKKPTDGLTIFREWRPTPSIHMPRWASRILLEVVSVRVERLQAISAKDILAEGAVLRSHTDQFGRNPVSAFDNKVYLDLLSLWAAGWQSINGPDSWAANPWVWVVEFKVLDQQRADK